MLSLLREHGHDAALKGEFEADVSSHPGEGRGLHVFQSRFSHPVLHYGVGTLGEQRPRFMCQACDMDKPVLDDTGQESIDFAGTS